MKPIIHFALIQLRDIFFALLLTFIILLIFMGKSTFVEFPEYLDSVGFGVLIGFSLWKSNQLIGWIVGRNGSWVKNPTKTLAVSLTLSFLVTISDIFLVYYLGFRYIFNISLLDNLNIYLAQMFLVLSISLVITISFYLASFFKWWKIGLINQERLKQEAIQLQLNALKSQVNPHFLFNSLSVLSSLIETNSEKAKLYVQKFAEIYRYVLNQSDKDLVPLQDEIDFISSYISLQKIRFGDSLKVSLNIDNYNGKLVSLSLQTLLENCLKHNVVSKEKPLKITIDRVENFLVVKNNVQRKKTISQSNGVGLDIINRQYKILTGRNVEVFSDESFFTVKLPIVNDNSAQSD
ncbi:MAG: two-component system, LytTR family, sensor kinase [Tenuifilum sp.]|uniref:sensor histidine kinase n=1 Tax=Tenuifilum sp. TaxID=2760880 RepID=UPI0024AB02A8|nr:histidine kinase [Tenuifilum sp.]MDI3527401.1 two-component system, LytTR family, sensor kinase [Tenuifilum sp.]